MLGMLGSGSRLRWRFRGSRSTAAFIIVTSRHPDLDAEQAYVDLAHAWLEAARGRAVGAMTSFRVGRGGTQQARLERETMIEAVLARLSRLEIGDRSLVFGRIGLDGAGERFYIGRVGLWDTDSNPVVVDWRAPVAEAFYRATGVQPLGLAHRRRFVSRGRLLLGIEDEFFGESTLIGFGLGDRGLGGRGVEDEGGLGVEGGGEGRGRASERIGGASDDDAPESPGRERIRVSGALAAALEAPRTGRLGDIVGTIQAEQDEVIRAGMPGVLAVQGGPGTGKTVVALHRASYLLYTHRFPLEDQGVLVLGPNRLFLAYIEQVLPSLGEAGVELAVLADLLRPSVRVARLDGEDVARVKGDPRMARVMRKAIRDRQRPLREDLVVGYGLQKLRLPVGRSARIAAYARRHSRRHNNGRRLVENAFFQALADTARYDDDVAKVREATAHRLEVREALEWMWPVLTPAHLLNDLFGSEALLRSASAGLLDPDEMGLLHRPRDAHASEMLWSLPDVALLDEAHALLGHRSGRRREDTVITYGHIVVDEAQDLSPMQLRMIARRSLNGSLTVVGDIAQATGAWAHDDWGSVLEELPERRPARLVELTVGYRIPEAAMSLANRVLPHAAPGIAPPTAVRPGGDEPRIVACRSGGSDGAAGPEAVSHLPERAPLRGGDADSPAVGPEAASGDRGSGDRRGGDAGSPAVGLVDTVVETIALERTEIGGGNMAVIVPDSLYARVRGGLVERGVDFAGPGRDGLGCQVTLVPVRLVKGLEVDAAIVVEPARIVAEERFGVRSLYVSLTRATKRVTVVHAEPLPDVMV